jgi:hypothetical protein
MELEGRSYGGGVLKLEPSEMQRVRVIMPTLPESDFACVFADADGLLRQGKTGEAVELADRVLLPEQLGLSRPALSAVVSARKMLFDRRLDRAARAR